MAFIRVRDLTHRFGNRTALDAVSFSVPKGGFVFITGPSGAGKTTLLRLLHGDMPVQQGFVSVAGFALHAIASGDLPRLRREASLIFQDYKILPERSVLENVSLPLEVRGVSGLRVASRAMEMIEALGLAPAVNEACGNLSGGEQQRVAIARALAVNPRLILADEPTGNLDADMASRLMQLFTRANAHGTTFIVATHSRRLPEQAPGSLVLAMEAGRIVTDADFDPDADEEPQAVKTGASGGKGR